MLGLTAVNYAGALPGSDEARAGVTAGRAVSAAVGTTAESDVGLSRSCHEAEQSALPALPMANAMLFICLHALTSERRQRIAEREVSLPRFNFWHDRVALRLLQ